MDRTWVCAVKIISGKKNIGSRILFLGLSLPKQVKESETPERFLQASLAGLVLAM